MARIVNYTEDEIGRALRAMGVRWNTLHGRLVSELRDMREKESPVKELADTDTVTVKELHDAEQRLRPLGFPSQVFPVQAILADVMEHREPEYPYGTVWKDHNGVVWMRASDGMWLRMGHEGKFSYTAPKRPLSRMDVI